MRRTVVSRSVADLEEIAGGLLENAGVLYPGATGHLLAQRAIEDAEPDFLSELDGVLRMRYFTAVLRRIRKEAKREKNTSGWLFGPIRELAADLPAKIPVGKGLTVDLDEAYYTDFKLYIIELNRKSEIRNRKRVAAAKKLMALWPARSRGRGGAGLTLAQVDAKKAGFAE